MLRRDLLTAAASAAAIGTRANPAFAAPRKVLRVAFNAAEVGFDPLQVSDESSLSVIDLIFEAPLTFDALARPALLRPLTAVALPEVASDFKRFVFTLRPGTYFADDPVFKGRPRELTAADYVYSIKRLYDPAVHSERLYQLENAHVLGLSELRRRVLAARTPFPYDTEVEGLRALDRYRFEVRLGTPTPRFAAVFAAAQTTGAVAREVIEAYADDLMAHPVGTGPYRLVEWRRGSRVVLERNPRFRELRFDSVAPEGDAVAARRRARTGRADPAVGRPHRSQRDFRGPAALAGLRRRGDRHHPPAAGLRADRDAGRQARALSGQARRAGPADSLVQRQTHLLQLR